MSLAVIYDYLIYEKLCAQILACNTITKFHKFKEALMCIISAMHKYDVHSQYDYIFTYVKNLEFQAALVAAEDKVGNANLSNLSSYLVLNAHLYSKFKRELEIFFQIILHIRSKDDF